MNKCSCVLSLCLGVGILHPKASLLLEAEALLVVWEGKMHCVNFWLR